MRHRWWAVWMVGLTCLAGRAEAQSKPYSLEDIATLVSSGVRASRILELVQSDCISFIVDGAAESRLRTAGADASLAGSLRTACYRGSALEVISDPAGAEVVAGGRVIGRTPLVTAWAPTRGLALEVRGPAGSRSVTVDIPTDRLVSVSAFLPQDTLAHADDGSAPRRPEEPVAPGPRSRVKPALFGAIVGAGAGFALASSPCKSTELNYRFDPDLGYNVPVGNGLKESSGTGCAAGVAVGGAAAGWLLSETWSRWQHRRKVARYERDRESYPARLQAFEAAQATAGAGGSVAEQNARIRERNQALGEPKVTTEAIRRLPSAAPAAP